MHLPRLYQTVQKSLLPLQIRQKAVCGVFVLLARGVGEGFEDAVGDADGFDDALEFGYLPFLNFKTFLHSHSPLFPTHHLIPTPTLLPRLSPPIPNHRQTVTWAFFPLINIICAVFPILGIRRISRARSIKFGRKWLFLKVGVVFAVI
jgi:hypothetical protein